MNIKICVSINTKTQKLLEEIKKETDLAVSDIIRRSIEKFYKEIFYGE